jgi:hypothetical protein
MGTHPRPGDRYTPIPSTTQEARRERDEVLTALDTLLRVATASSPWPGAGEYLAVLSASRDLLKRYGR